MSATGYAYAFAVQLDCKQRGKDREQAIAHTLPYTNFTRISFQPVIVDKVNAELFSVKLYLASNA